MTMRTPLKTARNLGSAKEGTDHFWKQRVTGVANVFLGLFLVWLIASLIGADHATVKARLANPVISLALLSLVLRQLLRSEPYRLRFDAAVLNLPVLGRLARGYNAARFANTLAILAAAGVPILKALQAAAETLNNRAMRADAMAALVMVREGTPLASALAKHRRFPGLLAMFSRLGEQTGQLPEMLRRAAAQLANEVQRRALQLATLLEPALIVGMGVVVLLIVLAVLLPIIQLNQLAR